MELDSYELWFGWPVGTFLDWWAGWAKNGYPPLF